MSWRWAAIATDREYEWIPLPFIESWSIQIPSCSHMQCASLFSIHEQEYPWHVQVIPSVFIVPMPKREWSTVFWSKIIPNGSPFTSPEDCKIKEILISHYTWTKIRLSKLCCNCIQIPLGRQSCGHNISEWSFSRLSHCPSGHVLRSVVQVL